MRRVGTSRGLENPCSDKQSVGIVMSNSGHAACIGRHSRCCLFSDAVASSDTCLAIYTCREVAPEMESWWEIGQKCVCVHSQLCWYSSSCMVSVIKKRRFADLSSLALCWSENSSLACQQLISLLKCGAPGVHQHNTNTYSLPSSVPRVVEGL